MSLKLIKTCCQVPTATRPVQSPRARKWQRNMCIQRHPRMRLSAHFPMILSASTEGPYILHTARYRRPRFPFAHVLTRAMLSLYRSYWLKPRMLKSAALLPHCRRHRCRHFLIRRLPPSAAPSPAMVKVFRPRSAFVKHLDPHVAVRVVQCHEHLEAAREAHCGDELYTEFQLAHHDEEGSDDDGDMTSYGDRIKKMNAEFSLYMLELDIARRMHELHLEQLRQRMTRQPAYPRVDPEREATMRLYDQAVSAAQPQMST